MKELSFENSARVAAATCLEADDAAMAALIRLAVAASMLASLHSVEHLPPYHDYAVLACFIYFLHAAGAVALSRRPLPATLIRAMPWADVVWLALLVTLTGGSGSLYFLGFLFPILAASFSRGFEEGALVAIVSAGMLAAAYLLLGDTDLPRLLMRTAFLLSLGYVSAYWGEAKLQLKRRLELLRDVSQISNPRFGAEQTTQSLLRRVCGFYNARRCILVLVQPETGVATVRKADARMKRCTPRTASWEVVAPMLALDPGRLVRYSRNGIRRWLERAEGCELKQMRWVRVPVKPYDHIAALLDAANFISLPVHLHGQTGRLFLVDAHERVKRADAEFLNQIVAQAFPAVETIELLDQMASQAASEERKRVALDLHDTAIQPYIGIRLGLNALRRKADNGNPLTPDIDTLIGVTEDVITDLRRFASTVGSERPSTAPLLRAALQRKIEQLRRLYAVEIVLNVQDVSLSDRMTGHISQLVQEGMSNICRHTLAQRGEVQIAQCEDRVTIQIANECGEDPPQEFTPRSITERVQALGGSVTVSVEGGQRTVVRMEIPV